MEKLKIDISKIGTACNAFLADNREVIGGIIGTIFTAKLCKSLGISLGNFGYFGNGFNKGLCVNSDEKNVVSKIGVPTTAMESGIYSIYKGTVGMSSSLSKMQEAERIYNILKNSKEPVDDSTKSYAIGALSAIQSSISTSLVRTRIGEIIEKVLAL